MFSRWYRENWTTLALTAMALVIVVALGVEWVFLNRERQTVLARPASPPPTIQAEAPPVEGSEFQLPDLDGYLQMSQRPLFMEGRRPGEDIPETAATAPAATTPLNMKLMGVVFSPKGSLALLVDSKGKYKRLREKDAHEGWTLVELAPDRVYLQQGDEKKDLPLLKTRPKQPRGPGVPGQPGVPPHQQGVPGAQPQPGQPPMPGEPGMEEQPLVDEEPVDNVDFEEPEPAMEAPEDLQ